MAAWTFKAFMGAFIGITNTEHDLWRPCALAEVIPKRFSRISLCHLGGFFRLF